MNQTIANQAYREAIPAALRPGATLSNDAIVIAAKHSSHDSEWVVLAMTAPGDGGEYVTWFSHLRTGEGSGLEYTVTVMGHYFPVTDFAAAVADFNERS
jgi:hypothetical protein